MSRDVPLRCRCGQVTGLVTGASPETTNRVVCYCADCQAFAHHLGRADLLDAHGGSDIVQVAPAALTFTGGAARIRCARLTPKGLHRWYAGCCGTPLGNTVGPAIPFVGFVAPGLAGDPAALDAAFGPPIGAVHVQSAVGPLPPGAPRFSLRVITRSLRRVLGWRLRGQAWPHPFFDRATGAPRYPIDVLSPAERAALRKLCGPRPGGSA